ncbi:MAG: hypothetical protein V7784_21720 [Oceanospirillaceae bacterium]
MHKPFFETLVGFLILLLIPMQLNAQLQVSTNRTQYSPRDNITLKVETTNPIDAPLDISSLQGQFLILDQKKMIINSYAEGKRSSIVRWEIQLRARKSGYVDIPSLQYNQDISEKFSIFVKSTSPTRFLPVSDMPVILDAQIEKEFAYENGLILYTLNIYSDQPLASGFTISPPKLAKSKIQLLEESEVQTVEIRNKTYQVIERRYAIFPTEMGRFIIEGSVFDGAQEDSLSMQARANNLEINVRTRQDFDNAQYWLPASSVTITETWTKNTSLQVGDVISREIKMSVQGIAAVNLPQIITQNPEIINIQENQISLTDKINKQGIQGTRIERQQIQLLERGELTFPAIQIYWWDVKQDSQQIASISKQILQVLPDQNGVASIEREIAQNQAEASKEGAINVIQTDVNWLLWALITLSVLSSLGWAFNLRKIKRLKERATENSEHHDTLDDDLSIPGVNHDLHASETQQHQSKSAIAPAPPEQPQFNAKAELNTFQALGRSCINNDLLTAERHLLEWSNHFWFEQHIQSIAEVAQCANSSSLNVLLAEMQELLEAQQNEQWQGKSLFTLLTSIRAS